jgi:cytochrome c biogenesis protein CcdA
MIAAAVQEIIVALIGRVLGNADEDHPEDASKHDRGERRWRVALALLLFVAATAALFVVFRYV